MRQNSENVRFELAPPEKEKPRFNAQRWNPNSYFMHIDFVGKL